MRHRPFPPSTERTRMGLEPAMRLYCAKRKVDFGVLYRSNSVRVQAGRHVYAANVKLTFGRGQAFWQVQAWTVDLPGPDREDRLYNNLTRALDRKLRELGWLK